MPFFHVCVCECVLCTSFVLDVEIFSFIKNLCSFFLHSLSRSHNVIVIVVKLKNFRLWLWIIYIFFFFSSGVQRVRQRYFSIWLAMRYSWLFLLVLLLSLHPRHFAVVERRQQQTEQQRATTTKHWGSKWQKICSCLCLSRRMCAHRCITLSKTVKNTNN